MINFLTSYSLNDFLLFSADVYWRLLDVYVHEYFFIAAATNVCFLLLLAGLTQPSTPRLIFLLLAPLWVWLGWRFYIIEYASINWSAYIMGLMCLLQAPFFLALSVLMRKRQFQIDFAVLITAIVYVCLLRPFIMWSVFPQLQISEIGLLPLPTLLLSLGITLAIKASYRWVLLLIPLALLTFETVTLFLLMSPGWQEIPVMIAFFMMLSVSSRYRDRNAVNLPD